MKRLLRYFLLSFIFSILIQTKSYAPLKISNNVYVNKLDNFKIHKKDHLGTFYGIKNGKKRIRGMADLEIKKGSIWIGTYAKNGNAYWKGYYKHFYDDRTPLYSYYEYDKAGKYKVIKERSSNEAEFLLAKEYILLDIKLPFDLTKKYVDISLKPDDIQNVAEMKKIQSLIEQNHTGFIELKKLFDKGLITPNEFLSRKDELLN